MGMWSKIFLAKQHDTFLLDSDNIGNAGLLSCIIVQDEHMCRATDKNWENWHSWAVLCAFSVIYLILERVV